MSQEHVEIVRKAFEAMSAGDRDRALGYVDSAMVVDATRRVFNPTTYLGVQGLWQMLADMDDVWEELRPEPREFVDAGERVVVTGRMVGKGKGSGVEVEGDFAGIWTIRAGRIVRWEICTDRAEALEAVGLQERMSQDNIELARRSIDSINRRDLDAYLTLMDDDVEAVSRLVPLEGVYHGYDGLRRWWETLFDIWPDFTVRVVELHAVGDLTLGTVDLRAHGASSNIPSEWTVCSVARWRRGKCVWWGNFRTRGEALEAVGLSE